MTVEWIGKRTYVSLIHMSIVTTIYWITLLRPSLVMWQLWSCSHALHGEMPVINKPPTNCVKLKMTLLLAIHHMRNGYGIPTIILSKYNRERNYANIKETNRDIHLVNTLLNLEYDVHLFVRLRSKNLNFLYSNLNKQYDVTLSRILFDILDHGITQWHSPLLRYYTHSLPCYRTGPC